jgi:hypothetical protein
MIRDCSRAAVRYGKGNDPCPPAAAYQHSEDAMADFTPHQQKIIKRYYDNQDLIQSQRLAELVTDLYLAEGKKRQRVWKAIVAALQKLKIPQDRIDHVQQQDNPVLVAEIVKEIQR